MRSTVVGILIGAVVAILGAAASAIPISYSVDRNVAGRIRVVGSVTLDVNIAGSTVIDWNLFLIDTVDQRSVHFIPSNSEFSSNMTVEANTVSMIVDPTPGRFWGFQAHDDATSLGHEWFLYNDLPRPFYWERAALDFADPDPCCELVTASQGGPWAFFVVVPEPGTLAFVGLGLAGLAATRGRRVFPRSSARYTRRCPPGE
jgi:hypothetical protein